MTAPAARTAVFLRTVVANANTMTPAATTLRSRNVLAAAVAQQRTLASSYPPPPPTEKHPLSSFRLPRVNRGTELSPDDDGKRPKDNEMKRPHTPYLTVFPGDYTDDCDNLSIRMDDDEEDEEMARWRQQLREQDAKERAQREKWIQNSIPPVYTTIIDERGRAYGLGRRKTASARVWIQPGMGEVVVNQRPFVEYFDRQSDRELVLAPLVATETCGMFDLQVMVQSGGLTGQAGAVRLGVARALNAYNPDTYRPPLKKLGYLERDYRRVERKKIGHLKARKSPQWVRR